VEGFHENKLRKLSAEGQAGIADLADEVGPRKEEPHDLLFAKAKLTKADLNFRRRTQFFYSYWNSRCHAVQGAGLASKLHLINPKGGLGNVHIAVSSKQEHSFEVFGLENHPRQPTL